MAINNSLILYVYTNKRYKRFCDKSDTFFKAKTGQQKAKMVKIGTRATEDFVSKGFGTTCFIINCFYT